jgi:secreted effector protein SseB
MSTINHQNLIQSPMFRTDYWGTEENNVSNPHPIGDTIAMMFIIMDVLSRQTSAKLDDMQKKSDISRKAQDMANQVEAQMAKLHQPEDTTFVPDEVRKYMRNNNIIVNDMTSEQFLRGKKGCDKADMMSVKSALESVSGRASDFVQQSQLKMQQLMQNYNTAVQMVNSLQSMLAESTKGIAAAIR